MVEYTQGQPLKSSNGNHMGIFNVSLASSTEDASALLADLYNRLARIEANMELKNQKIEMLIDKYIEQRGLVMTKAMLHSDYAEEKAIENAETRIARISEQIKRLSHDKAVTGILQVK